MWIDTRLALYIKNFGMDWPRHFDVLVVNVSTQKRKNSHVEGQGTSKQRFASPHSAACEP
jgi:hypothetical protein